MEPTEKKEETKIYIFNIGVPKPVVYSLITLMISGAITFSYAFAKQTANTNKELPQEKAKTELINQKVDKLTIDNVIMKVDVSNVKQSLKDVAEEQKSQREILLQILYRTNQTYNNTK